MPHGREVLAPGYGDRPRHRHLEPYAIAVVAGAFDQVGYAGRVRVGAGELLVQPALDCHANRMPRGCSATIVRLPWFDDGDSLGGVYTLADLDAVVRAAERDVRAAAAIARAGIVRHRAPANDLPDRLAVELVAARGGDRALRIDAWAERAGLARETVARAFGRAYGVSPRRFRCELRARAACLRIARSVDSLAAIAVDVGYADQAHMTREVLQLLGMTPAAWRRDPRACNLTNLA